MTHSRAGTTLGATITGPPPPRVAYVGLDAAAGRPCCSHYSRSPPSSPASATRPDSYAQSAESGACGSTLPLLSRSYGWQVGTCSPDTPVRARQTCPAASCFGLACSQPQRRVSTSPRLRPFGLLGCQVWSVALPALTRPARSTLRQCRGTSGSMTRSQRSMRTAGGSPSSMARASTS
jgi:hypothetical protein